MKKINAAFYTKNRKNLSEKLPNSLIVLSAHSLMQYSADTSYPFRQDSNFYYLTGINEPDLVLVIDTKKMTSILLLPAQSEYQKHWDGEHDTEKLKKISGVDTIQNNEVLEQLVKDAIAQGKSIGYVKATEERIEPYGIYANPARRVLQYRLTAICSQKQMTDIRIEIARLRQVKQPLEIEEIQAAINSTGKALADIKNCLEDFDNEADIERMLSSYFYEHADGHAFEPIVASGENAATIHYRANNNKIKPGGLMLLDVGAQQNSYAADISRTWSTKEPTQRQQALWDATLRIQEKGLSLLGPGVTLRGYQKELEEFAQKEFQSLNCSMVGRPFPHGFSHYLGLDVHDAGDYDLPLEINTVVTVEPGIYLPDEGIGMRVEDDVVITENGIKNLSADIPKVLY
jgi:Xaa-Pro aminopeptidase